MEQRRLTFIYEDYIKVKNYFNNHHDNRSPVIAKEFNITENKVNWYLDIYLSLKNNYMGEEVELPKNFLKQLK